jgi:hypothetical protein
VIARPARAIVAPHPVQPRANFPALTIRIGAVLRTPSAGSRDDRSTLTFCASGPLDAFAKRLDSVLTRPRGARIVGDA